ncbi:diguanylate cyclase [Sulfurimonas sp.]|uniref:diguanylate cyclase n=1 Tax=Sulfurimonas sp. TaxID=2022749 RepID=UPI002B45B623|nr:diguanylate cyclase [Sulfurimonas sp.]
MKKTILCIDDTEENLFTIKSVIDTVASNNYELILCNSAHEGLDILLRQRVDLILLDIMMPEIDGFSAAKMIRSNKRTKEIPIIFVTAKKDDETIEECYKLGGVDYINKPFNHIELLSRISFHLELKNKEVELKKEKNYAQGILDFQENIIVVTDGKKATSVNSALLDFYDMDSIESFIDTHKCISFSFIEENGYFSLALLKIPSMWIYEVMKLSVNEDVVVKILQNEVEYIFNLKANVFTDKYIVTLTDITQLTKISLEYKHEANYDALTKIYNRNMFHKLIDAKMLDSKKYKRPFIFILLDIDFFKNVNDNYGHLVGDKVLQRLSALIHKHIRSNDIFARWGGEEFVLALDVGLEKGIEIANSLRKHIELEVFEEVKSITCSFGITEHKEDDTLEEMIGRADTALYEAKEKGRNRVCQQ